MCSDFLDIGMQARTLRSSAQAQPRMMVGIDGPGGSGKSTLATQLVQELGNAFVVHTDDFYLPSQQRNERTGGEGPLLDLSRLYEQVIRPGATGSTLRYQRYDWNRDELAEWIVVPEDACVIVEGVYSLSRALGNPYTYKIWCRADPAIRLERGLQRDGEHARSRWVDLWMPAEDAYALEEKPECSADLILDSSSDGGSARTFRIVPHRHRSR